jgi:hypothetical protein
MTLVRCPFSISALAVPFPTLSLSRQDMPLTESRSASLAWASHQIGLNQDSVYMLQYEEHPIVFNGEVGGGDRIRQENARKSG